MKKIIFALLVGSISAAPTYATGFSGLKDRLTNRAKEAASDEIQANAAGASGLKGSLANVAAEAVSDELQSNTSGLGGLKGRLLNRAKAAASDEIQANAAGASGLKGSLANVAAEAVSDELQSNTSGLGGLKGRLLNRAKAAASDEIQANAAGASGLKGSLANVAAEAVSDELQSNTSGLGGLKGRLLNRAKAAASDEIQANVAGAGGLKGSLANIATEALSDETQPTTSGAGGLKGRLKNITKGVTGGDSQPDAQSTEAAAVNTLLGLVQQDSLEEEIALGQEMTEVILGASKLYPSKNIQNYVNLVGRHIASQSERAELPWTFGVLNARTVNAFAAPGGYVLISKGLYDLLETEDELAAVLGHEIAHVVNKHHLNVIKKQSVVELGVKAAGDKRSKELAQLATAMTGKMLARGLDKSAEYQADRDGIVLAARAGYDASAMLKVLDNLELHGQRDSAVLTHMLATHPAPAARELELAKAVNPEVEAAAVLSPAASRISRYRK